MKKKITIEDLAIKLDTVVENMATKRDLERFTTKEELKESLKGLVTKEELKESLRGLATKEELRENLKGLATKEELTNEIDGLAIIFKENFDRIDFKFDVIDDHFRDVDKRFDQMDKRFDRLEHEVVKTNDSFAKLHNFVDCEIAAVRGRLKRVDKKIGLAA